MFCDYRLKVFHTVATCGSFTAAAKELGITQPAVSNHISELEGTIGDKLFTRSRKQTLLTPKGKVLLEYAEKILYLYRCAAKELLPASREQIRGIKIAAVPEAARYVLKPLVEYFTRIHPETEVSILERNKDEALSMLDDSEVDMAITDSPEEGTDSMIFATTCINGSATPMHTFYLSKAPGKRPDGALEDFILCCRTFK